MSRKRSAGPANERERSTRAKSFFGRRCERSQNSPRAAKEPAASPQNRDGGKSNRMAKGEGMAKGEELQERKRDQHLPQVPKLATTYLPLSLKSCKS